MRPRIAQELTLLRSAYGEVDHVEQGGEDWFRLLHYSVPAGWKVAGQAIDEAPVAFLIKADYPSAAPYGFLMPSGIMFDEQTPGSTGNPPSPVPFGGEWTHFSWSVEDWSARGDPTQGSNLVAWCRSFRVRLLEGA